MKSILKIVQEYIDLKAAKPVVPLKSGKNLICDVSFIKFRLVNDLLLLICAKTLLFCIGEGIKLKISYWDVFSLNVRVSWLANSF